MSRLAATAMRFSGGWPGRTGALVLPVIALLGLLVPAYHDVALRLWKYEEHAFAPLLTGLSFWLLWHRLRHVRLAPDPGVPLLGLSLFVLGAAVYAVGRSQQVELLELGACIPLLAGALDILGGRQALLRMRFPILFLLFSLPYPGWLIDSLTNPLKELISIGAEYVLYAAGYPVARSGVVLGLGPYRLLVADACSGLHSLIFLAAMGLLYVHLTGYRPRLHRIALVAALVPIAVLANFVRVLVLLLLTHHFGDAVGQGYWHELAGLMLFVSAFAMLTGLDFQLSFFSAKQSGSPAIELRCEGPKCAASGPGWGRCLAVSAMMLAIAASAAMLVPTRMLAERRPVPDLESQIPKAFGEWRNDDKEGSLLVAPDVQASVKRLYSQAIARTYVNRQGQRIMLSVAYGGNQLGNELQAHRPEFCYKAQGFTLSDSSDARIAMPPGVLPVRRLVARQNHRIEPITYWMTVGETAALPGIQRKLAQLRHGLRGEVPDGMLVRVSSLGSDTGKAFNLHESFIAELRDALPDPLRRVLAPQSPA